MSLTGDCQCPTPLPMPPIGVRRVCAACGKIVTPDGSSSDTIPSEHEFARRLIGQHQQVILKHRQMIDDIKRQYGLKP